MSKERILEAATELLKSEGIKGVTMRKIAALAETNAALINYYFGSKENLINEIFQKQLDSFRDAFHVLSQTDMPPRERLKAFLRSYTSLLREHPDLAKRLLSPEPFFESHTQYVDFMKQQGFEKLISTVREIVGSARNEKVLLMIQQMFAAICFPIIAGSRLNPTVPSSLLIPSTTIEEQIDVFFECYFFQFPN